MLFLLAACTSRQNGHGDEDHTFTVPSVPSETTPWEPWEGPDSVVPLTDSETFVTVEAGYELTGTLVFEDFDGDEVVDLLVGLVGTGTQTDELRQAIVRGPLDDLHLPSDAWVYLDGWTTSVVPYELTGDDHLDLLVTYDSDGPYGGAPESTWLVPHPYDGSVVPGPGWMEVPADVLDSWPIDVDGDGTSDKVQGTFTEADGESLEVTWGPIERWAGPADVTVTPTCRQNAEQYPYALAASRSYFTGDIDSDGSPELQMASWDWVNEADCGDFTVSLPASGVVDPFTSPLGIDRLFEPSYQPIGDWTGDGMSELLYYDNTVVVSPVVLDADGVHGSELATAHGDILRVIPQSFDLDGDGRAEAVVLLDDEVVAVFSPDLEQLTDPDVAVAWELPWGFSPVAYIDSGHAWLAMFDGTWPTEIRRIDLGPATAL